MNDLKLQIQEEIKNVQNCKLYDIKNMSNMQLNPPRDGQLCLFNYTIPCGLFKHKRISIGVELPKADYPRLPPHFIHLKPEDFNQDIDKLGQVHQNYRYEDCQWIALSRPPQDIWDAMDISKKNLGTFFNAHLYKLWKSL